MIATSAHVIWKVIGEEAVFLDTRAGSYYLLNDSGARIWTLFTEGKTVGEVAALISQEFQTSCEAAREDIAELIASLLDAEIITEQPN